MSKQKKTGYIEPFYLYDTEDSARSKRTIVALIALAIVMIAGMVCSVQLNQADPTFNGNVNVAALEQDPSAYDLADADGAAYVIVSENLERTNAKNVCFSVVFNFRGYDTMGESFILIAALAGSLCILRQPKKKKQIPAEKEASSNG